MKSWLLPVIAVTLAACASSPAVQPAEAPPARQVALDPVGTFDFTTTVEGTSAAGTINILRTDSGYGGTITSNVTDAMPIRTVTVNDNRVDVIADTPDGPLSINMIFTGNQFTGTWSLGAMSGTHTGQRRAP